MPFKFKDKPKHLYAEDVKAYLRQLDEVFNMIEEEMKDDDEQSSNQDQPPNNPSAAEIPRNHSMIRNTVNLDVHLHSEVIEESKSLENEHPNNEQDNSFSESSVNVEESPRIRQNNVNLKRNINIASHANSSSIEV
jgi:hypothetical protein